DSAGSVPWRCGDGRYVRSRAVGMLVGPGELHVDRPGRNDADYRILRLTPHLLESAARRLGRQFVSLSVAEHEIRERPANDALLSLHRDLDAAPDSAGVPQLIN